MTSDTRTDAPNTFVLRREGNNYLVPPELRQLFQSSWILTCLEDRLVAYEPSHWEEVKLKILSMESNPQKEALMRLFLGRASEVDFRGVYFRVPTLLKDLSSKDVDLTVCFEGYRINLIPRQ